MKVDSGTKGVWIPVLQVILAKTEHFCKRLMTRAIQTGSAVSRNSVVLKGTTDTARHRTQCLCETQDVSTEAPSSPQALRQACQPLAPLSSTFSGFGCLGATSICRALYQWIEYLQSTAVLITQFILLETGGLHCLLLSYSWHSSPCSQNAFLYI